MSEQPRTAGAGTMPGGGSGAGQPHAGTAEGRVPGVQRHAADRTTGDRPVPDARLGLGARSPEPGWLAQASDEERWDLVYGAVRDAAAGQAGPTPPSEWESAPAPAGGTGEPQWYARPPAPGGADQPAAKAAAAPAGVWKRRLAIGVPVVVVLAVIAGTALGLRGTSTAAHPGGPRPASAGATAGPDGIIAEDVSPFDFRAGDCFTDFQAATRNATVVDCGTPHAAQIVGTFAYQASDPFPGKDALNVKAEQVCTAIKLGKKANAYPSLRTSYGMPSEGTWQEGDRRIDCFVIVDGGNKLKESLIAQ